MTTNNIRERPLKAQRNISGIRTSNSKGPQRYTDKEKMKLSL
jgi:hypothetical protein